MNVRIAVDLAMAALILTAMAYRIIGGITHEIIGITTFALFTTHNLLNLRWYKTIGKGGYTKRRYGIITVNLLLAMTALVLVVSGILHSKELFGLATEEDKNSVFGAWQIHALAAYWVFVLVSVHLGIYWSTIVNKFWPAANRTLCNIFRIGVAIAALWGIRAVLERKLGSKLILYYSFDFWHTSEPIYSYMASYLTIMILFASVTYYCLRIRKIFLKSEGNKCLKNSDY
jgi:hypothetical protein